MEVELIQQELAYYEQQYDEINEQHNTLLCRLVGVSDDILREQLTEEYQLLLAKLNEIAEIKKTLEQQYLDSLTSEWVTENKQLHANKYIEDTLIVCIELNNNINLQRRLRDMRLRIPASLESKRELFQIAKEFNKKIKVLDFQGNEINSFGSGSEEWVLYADDGKTYYTKNHNYHD